MKNTIHYTDTQLDQAERILQMRKITDKPTVIFYVTLGQSASSKDVRFVLYRLKLKVTTPHINPYTYYGPLSDDLHEACRKAVQRCGNHPIELEFGTQCLKKAYQKWTPEVVQFGKHKGVLLEECEPKYITWVARGCPIYDDLHEAWVNNHYGGEEFTKTAQEVAVRMNLGVIEDDRFYTHEQYAKYLERKQARDSIKHDHYYTEKDRITEQVTVVAMAGYNTEWGYVQIITMQTEDGKVVIYKGTSFPEDVDLTSSFQLTGTIKHGEYNGTKQTFVQRVKVLMPELANEDQ